MENKPKIENTQQLQAKPHFQSSVDHEANHTSGQRPVKRQSRKSWSNILWSSIKIV